MLSLNIRFDGEHDAMGVGNRLVLRTPPASNGFDGEHDAMGVGNRLVLRTPPASNGPKCTCTVVAVYPVTSAYHARDSTCHAHSLAFVKFEVPFCQLILLSHSSSTYENTFAFQHFIDRRRTIIFGLKERAIPFAYSVRTVLGSSHSSSVIWRLFNVLTPSLYSVRCLTVLVLLSFVLKLTTPIGFD